MGQPTKPHEALLIVAAFSRHDESLAWARRKAQENWGPIILESDRFSFENTGYYDAQMGPGVKKTFWVFDRFYDLGKTVDTKLLTNAWENEYAARSDWPEPRPLNLDPGYLTLAKLVLSSTKNNIHRIYLDRGIYAEITLTYRHGRWLDNESTFPDYRRADYQAFFSKARTLLHQKCRQINRA
jgi:Domain of unknown function (DUF4416)